MRRVAKAVNFGIIYGQGAFGLSQAIGIPQSEARTFIDTYFERFAAVPAFVDKTIENGQGARLRLHHHGPSQVLCPI